MFRGALVAAAALTLVSCGGSSSGSSAQLDPAVSMPSGFPSDVPIYPGSRLTATDAVQSSGSYRYNLTFETIDGVDKVAAFYTAHLNEGDLKEFGTPGPASDHYFVQFGRVSSASDSGQVIADVLRPGVTKIVLTYLHCAAATC